MICILYLNVFHLSLGFDRRELFINEEKKWTAKCETSVSNSLTSTVCGFGFEQSKNVPFACGCCLTSTFDWGHENQNSVSHCIGIESVEN